MEGKLEDISPDAKVGMYLDLSFYKKVGNANPEKITNLHGKSVQVAIEVPEKLRGGSDVTRIFYVVRIHDGVAEIIARSVGSPIYADCDRFSTYAILYEDTEKGSGPHVLSSHPVFNDTLEKDIAAAPENGTVTISTKRWISIRRGVLETLAVRPDVTLSISFVYEEEEYILTIKGDDPKIAEYLATEELFYGFIYLGDGFGLEKAAEVSQS